MQTQFPFKLSDLRGITIKRTDGTVTKMTFTHAPVVTSAVQKTYSSGVPQDTTTRHYTTGFSDFCTHTPGKVPLATFTRGDTDMRLWIANASGARATRTNFDFVLDAGDILDPNIHDMGEVLKGDSELVELLSDYVTVAPPTRLLKIDWDDRQEPMLSPEFWVELNKILYGDVMTCCVGGHGRSGTTFTCLTLVNAEDYDALDAIIHTRAVHCPRAIESIVQHEYINEVATFLGRTGGNAKDASKIADYKAAFMASTKPTAVRTRKELGWS